MITQDIILSTLDTQFSRLKIFALPSLLVWVSSLLLGSHIHEQLSVLILRVQPKPPRVSPDTHTLYLVYPILTSYIELKQQEPKLNSTTLLMAVFP